MFNHNKVWTRCLCSVHSHEKEVLHLQRTFGWGEKGMNLKHFLNMIIVSRNSIDTISRLPFPLQKPSVEHFLMINGFTRKH